MTNFFQLLNDLKDKGRYRSLNLPAGIDLTSNDYLGFAADDVLRDAALSYLQEGGTIGAAGSRLLRGHCEEHAALEDYAARFFTAPKCLYLGSGFQANTTLFQTLSSRHDVIIYDEFVHASAREGIQNSHAMHIKVQHNDAQGFEDACKKLRETCKGQLWIAVESLYSMDGDVAPLEDLFEIAARYDAMLVVDEAHAVGAMGQDGKGLAFDVYDAFPEYLITLHTCGKALGVAGAVMCASEDVIDVMINKARGFIYSTAPMPLQAHLVQKALEVIGSDEGQKRRDHLKILAEHAQQLFGGAGSYIVPIMIGDDERSIHVAQNLQQKGWDIRAIRPPTVPEGTARLRLSLSARLEPEQLENFAADFFEEVMGDDRQAQMRGQLA